MVNHDVAHPIRNALAGLNPGLAILLIGTAIIASVQVADAQDIRRVDARRLSCAAVQDIIHAEGAVILRSRSPNSGRLLWERYVAHRGFCFANEITEYRTVSTVDTNRCSVKLCRERPERRRFFDD